MDISQLGKFLELGVLGAFMLFIIILAIILGRGASRVLKGWEEFLKTRELAEHTALASVTDRFTSQLDLCRQTQIAQLTSLDRNSDALREFAVSFRSFEARLLATESDSSRRRGKS